MGGRCVIHLGGGGGYIPATASAVERLLAVFVPCESWCRRPGLDPGVVVAVPLLGRLRAAVQMLLRPRGLPAERKGLPCLRWLEWVPCFLVRVLTAHATSWASSRLLLTVTQEGGHYYPLLTTGETEAQEVN